MSNKKSFKKIIADDLNKEKNYNAIMSKIENNSERKVSFKFKYAYIVLILLVISIVGVSAGPAIHAIKNYRIETKDNLPNNKSKEDRIIYNNKLNKDYDSKLFKENEYYTYNEIEEKLQLKLLKNKYFDSNIYLLTSLKANNDKIAQVGFTQLNSDKSAKTIEDSYWFSFTINTNYSNEETTAGIFRGHTNGYKEYYIKSLNTYALISIPGDKSFKCGSSYVSFSYNSVVYTISFRPVCFDVDKVEGSLMLENELYDFLEAFTLD